MAAEQGPSHLNGGTMEIPLWARQLHNMLLLYENARNEKEEKLFSSAACAVMRRHIREQYRLDDKYAQRRRQAVGRGQ